MLIDFVILWVDGNDEEWLLKKEKYKENCSGDSRSVRFRDWDNLQYWFRSIEKYTPWVNKIHFVTEGHIPKWLNTNCAKLNIVKHEDFIEENFLPLFNSRAIESHLHKIPNLSEQFVYFNDDMFITNSIEPTFFFKNNLPCDSRISNPIQASNDLSITIMRNMKVINKYFKKPKLQELFKYKYKLHNIRNFILHIWPSILGYYDPHQPTSFLKETFYKVWEKERDILITTSESRFKNDTNVNQYLFRYWQLASGNFYPRKVDTMKMMPIKTKEDVMLACEYILNKKYQLLCINDTDNIYDFDDATKQINDAFEKMLPKKSKFEL